MIRHLLASSALILLLMIPGISHAQGTGGTASGFLREGVFGCSAGRYPLDVAALSAVGGVYVPVNDAAVTLNTGYLVYKECVLDGVVAATREAASAAMVRSILTAANRGRNGQPMFVTRPAAEVQQRRDTEIIEFLKDYNLKDVCSPFQQRVKVAIANTYYQQTRDQNASYRCSAEPNELSSRSRGEFQGWDQFVDLLNPANNEMGAFTLSGWAADQRAIQRSNELTMQWSYGDGWYPREERVCTNEGGEEKCEWVTLTPANMIAQIVNQAVTSGFRQLENASEIDQIVNSLFSGLTNQIMGDIRGFTGVAENRLGRAPYLDQLSAAASGRLRDSAANTGIAILNVAIAVEQEFNAKKRAIKSLLDQAAAQLRAAETACWVKVEQAVRNLAAQEGVQIRVSTTTEQITGGTVALRLGAVQIQPGTAYTMNAQQSTVLQSAQLSLNTNAALNVATQQDIGVPVTGAIAPGAGGSVTLNTTATNPFAAGTLALTLNQGQRLPIGEVRFPLTAVSPFLQAAVSLIVDFARQFADRVIADQIAPVLTQANQDIAASDRALALLLELANDLRNTGSASAQRIALERLDGLIAQNLIHTPADVTAAEKQRADVEGLLRTLVEDTIRSWTEGGGWCNVTNPNVVREWLNRWRI